MAHQLTDYMTRAVPRYTSYPTAPHFRTDFDPVVYGSWLSQLDPAKPVSLYLHVPFCRKLCWYCGCNMKLAARYEPLAAYTETLLKELDLVAAHLPGRMTLSHLHWGGGTPTALEPDDLARVMARVSELFDYSGDAEIAIESDPRTLTPEMTSMIGRLGFNRASFGVQEFDPKVQLAINRVQPPEMVREAVDGLRRNGVKAINFDLIYGLPFQTVETLVKTIGICNDIDPDRLALFGYAHVPWMAKKQRRIDEAALPGASERMAQAKAAADALVEAGYEPIGLDHFARPDDALTSAYQNGTLHRNFQGYTTDHAETLIGVGATSIGRTPGGYVQNTVETGAWSRSVEAGVLPVSKGLALDDEDRMRAAIIESLMCYGEAEPESTGQAFGRSPGHFADEFEELSRFEADGIVALQNGSVRVTEKGRPVIRTVAAVFDLYLATRIAKHSVAV